MTLTTEQTLARSMSEADFQRQVTDLAELLGYQWAHFRPAQTSKGWRTPVSGPLGKGWPDLILIRERDHRILAIECKAKGGRVTEEQKSVLDAFRAAHVETYAVWPQDFDKLAEWLR